MLQLKKSELAAIDLGLGKVQITYISEVVERA